MSASAAPESPEIDGVPLTLAAQRLAVSYAVAWRLVLVGQLRGEKTAHGWRVDPASLASMIVQRRGTMAGAA